MRCGHIAPNAAKYRTMPLVKPPRLRSAVRNSPDEAAEYAERHATWTEDTQRANYWRLTDAQKTEFDRRYNGIPAPTTVRRKGLAPMTKPSQLLCSDWLHLLFLCATTYVASPRQTYSSWLWTCASFCPRSFVGKWNAVSCQVCTRLQFRSLFAWHFAHRRV